ncbi:MAG: helix-turn-helix transcriptional regulator [Pyrinomonadaceae bacterium]
MSTIILDASHNTSIARYISLSGVATEHSQNEDLADYVRRVRNGKGYSLRDVEIASLGKISKGYVGQIENRTVLGQSVTPLKLRALAKGLGVPEDEIFTVARGLPLVYEDPLDLRGLFDGWEDATDADRAAALDDLRMIAERFQRKRKAKPPDDKGKGKGKKRA